MTVTPFELLQIMMGFIGSVGFAILFNVRGKKLIAAGVGGLLSWGFYVLLKFITESEPIRYFIVAVLMSLYAEFMARRLKTPTTTFLITSLIPLIPGGSLYYTMSAMLESHWDAFLVRGSSTVSLAVALALGIVLTTAVAKMVLSAKAQIRQWRMQNMHK